MNFATENTESSNLVMASHENSYPSTSPSLVENEVEYVIASYLVKDVAFVRQVLEYGVKEDWFLNVSLRHFFFICKQLYNKHKVILTKKHWLEKVAINPDIVPNERWRYESFYDDLLTCDYEADDLPTKLEQFRNSVVVYKNSQILKSYANEIEQYGPVEAHERMLKRLQGIEIAVDAQRKYYLSDMEAEGGDIALEDANNRVDNPQLYAGYKTGFESIDSIFNGFQKGTLTLIFGLSSSGKTTFVRTLSMNMKKSHEANILVISLEERRLQFFRKVACAELGISLKRWMRGELSEEEIVQVEVWNNQQKNVAANRSEYKVGWLKVLQIPAKQYNMQEIDSIIDKELGDQKIDVIVLDHIGLLKPIRQIGDKINVEFGDSSKYFREMAERRNAVAILLAQAGRNAVKVHKGKREEDLQIENVENSNQPFQDSENVFGIRRAITDKEVAVVTLLKQRDGEGQFNFNLRYDKDRCTYYDMPEMIGGSMTMDSTMKFDIANPPQPPVPPVDISPTSPYGIFIGQSDNTNHGNDVPMVMGVPDALEDILHNSSLGN